MDQTWSNWISDEIIIEIYHQIFNYIYFLIRLNQIFPKWIKMDQTWSIWWNNHWRISLDFQIYLFFDQIESDLSKMDLPASNWISDEIIIEIYHQIFNYIYFLIRLNQIFPKWIKMDQTWSIWWNNHWNYHVLLFCIAYDLFNIFNLFNQLYILVF